MRHAQNNSWHGLLVTQLVMHTTFVGHVGYLCSCTPCDSERRWSGKKRITVKTVETSCCFSPAGHSGYMSFEYLHFNIVCTYVCKANMLIKERFIVSIGALEESADGFRKLYISTSGSGLLFLCRICWWFGHAEFLDGAMGLVCILVWQLSLYVFIYFLTMCSLTCSMSNPANSLDVKAQ